MNENLYDILKARFPGNPDAPCLILPDGEKVSYGRLDRESARYSALLVSLGVQPGTVSPSRSENPRRRSSSTSAACVPARYICQ